MNLTTLLLFATTLIGGKCGKEEEATGESSVLYFTLESTTSIAF